MYEWIRPDILLPVHGEMRHMAEQARLGLAHGIPHAVVQGNGDVVRLAPGKAAIIGQERAGRLVLDGDVILPADGNTINERRKLGLHGQISVAVARDAKGRLAGEPQLRLQGIPLEEDRDDFLSEAADEAGAAVSANMNSDEENLRERIRLAVRRVATRWTGKKPIVDVLILSV
jgi:ribonuclease J